MEPDDLIILDELRELTNAENADEVIWQKNLAAERSRASAEVIGHDKQRGWRVRQIDGTEVNNPSIHTTGALGRGLRVDLNRGPTSAAIDTLPTGKSNLSSSTTASTKSDTETTSYFGSTSWWRRDPENQSCEPVSYAGGIRYGDYATEAECLAALRLKSWGCRNGACVPVAPGTGIWDTQEECLENGIRQWAVRDGKCTLLPPDQWCNDTREPRFKSQAECENNRYRCINGECIPDPSGPYTSKAECETALVPATFTGGQCITLYRIYATAPAFYGGAEHLAVGNITGPIGSLYTPGVDGTGRPIYYFNSGQGPVSIGSGPNYDLGVKITRVVRQDGQPDNCGDLPKRCP